MKTVLITGANGFLGQHLCKAFASANYKLVATGRGESRLIDKDILYENVDLSDAAAIRNLITTYQPSVIIHNAAMSKPDECANNRAECIKVNVDSTRLLLQQFAGHFIYISTDFIFGEGGPHAEDATPEPLNFYGETKLQSEVIVKQLSATAAIVRPVFIYGETWPGIRPTFLHWVKNNLEQGKSIKVVNDQLRTPTYVGDICAGIKTIVDKAAKGDYNLAGKDIISPYEMAIKTAAVLQLDTSLIESVTADTFVEPVKRAKQSGLKINKAVKELNYNPLSFEEGIYKTFA